MTAIFRILGPKEVIHIDRRREVHIAKKSINSSYGRREVLDLRIFLVKNRCYTKSGVCIPWELAKLFDAAWEAFKETNPI